MIRRIFLCLVLLLPLAACQRPTTYGPQIDKSAVEAERAEHAGNTGNIPKHGVGPDGQKFSGKHKQELLLRLNRVAKNVARAGGEICVQIRPPESPCSFDFVMDSDGGLNAYADGSSIHVTPLMVELADTDEQLALVLSHEMAHNIMAHVSAKTTNAIAGTVLGLAADVLAASQGFDTSGAFTRLGSDVGAVSYSVSFEQEADYVGLYILARSGYKPERAVTFWRRLSAAEPNGAYGGVTHPSNPERSVAMQATLAEIEYKRLHGIALLPDFKQ